MAHPERPLRNLAELGEAPESEQRERGYYHTLREILQQPSAWPETLALVTKSGVSLEGEEGPLLLTGSGSSFYIGESLAPLLGSRARAVAAGDLLTDFRSYAAESPKGTVVSFARSGDSPESCGVVDSFLDRAPDWRHVVITCNREGALATRYRGRSQVTVLLLPDRTNDRSLVMTSSFTNLWLAGRAVGAPGPAPDVSALARAAESLFQEFRPPPDFGRAVYLGGGPRYGAAREAALKMLEMTDGEIPAFAETFLGLRHGPMCALRERTLLVGFLSAEEPHRSYERDLLNELKEKAVGSPTILVGKGGDFTLDVGDDDAPLLDVVVGQLLGLFRSLALGLRPDAPSAKGIISRVVRKFEIH